MHSYQSRTVLPDPCRSQASSFCQVMDLRGQRLESFCAVVSQLDTFWEENQIIERVRKCNSLLMANASGCVIVIAWGRVAINTFPCCEFPGKIHRTGRSGDWRVLAVSPNHRALGPSSLVTSRHRGTPSLQPRPCLVLDCGHSCLNPSTCYGKVEFLVIWC